MPTFHDRSHAGKVLASKLERYKDQPNVLVLGLPRGGVVVAYEVARELNVPLDVFVVRKLGVPGQEELAMGAIATGEVRVLNPEVISAIGITDEEIQAAVEREQRELLRRERLYRGDRPEPAVQGQTVILVDDGLATGASMRAAVAALRQMGPARIVVAVPTAPPEACRELGAEVDEVICAMTPSPFFGVGLWYEEFPQISDQEVREILDRARQEAGISR